MHLHNRLYKEKNSIVRRSCLLPLEQGVVSADYLLHRKAKMQREIDGLRRALQLVNEVEEPRNVPPSPPPHPHLHLHHPSSVAAAVVPQSDAGVTSFYPSLEMPSTLTAIPRPGQRSGIPTSSHHASARHSSPYQYPYHPPSITTIPSAAQPEASVNPFSPSLDGLEIEPQKLEDCYSLSVLPFDNHSLFCSMLTLG